ncbi:MAG: glycosyltransferase family 39 protein [Gemmatimonas sp.]|jgi:4-amino-4-deoxy-L-arabinose transferase-like glycosyltransferase|uniref:glycosyltransferase family 39 protein n=2 Tax=Gemmatimonas sp. TaxID=1962908 RepID=UPI0022BEFF42|nr:glycosyltransferase family 39 protein [Gemmatimonas sp.]MCZ8011618.1 glycosyltransferase family 39 protein [Gemmatimonas sp.]MCZ8267771.1 glycosyltransferase family 39 protein [Gemmatimonas sp.]
MPTPSHSTGTHVAPARERATPWVQVGGWVLAAALLRGVLSALVPLLPDETYYWEWSRRLEAGYFDHPPGIALLIRTGTLLFGNSTAGVRAGPALAALGTHLAAIACAWQLAGRGNAGRLAARRAAMLVTLLPIATLGLVLATPDAALFATAMIALLAVERALATPVRSWASFLWWLLAGVALGGAFVAKYTAVLLPMGLVIACLVHPALRRRYAEAGPWVAGAVALALFAPVVAWNLFNNWISFRFQLGHGFNAVSRGNPVSRELEMLGAQAGLASPILFGLLTIVVWVALRDGWRTRRTAQPTDLSARRFALAVVAVVPLGFFAISAWRRPVEANWPAMIYPAAMTLLATSPLPVVQGVWWRRGAWLAAALLAVVTVQAATPILPLAPRRDPIARAHGWRALADSVAAARRDPFLDGTVDRWVAADRYQDASELAFHLPDQPTVFSLNLGGRTNHYDVWPNAWQRVRPGDGLIVAFDADAKGDSLARVVGTWFKAMRPGALVPLRRNGGTVTTRRLWLYRIAQQVPRTSPTHPEIP